MTEFKTSTHNVLMVSCETGGSVVLTDVDTNALKAACIWIPERLRNELADVLRVAATEEPDANPGTKKATWYNLVIPCTSKEEARRTQKAVQEFLNKASFVQED